MTKLQQHQAKAKAFIDGVFKREHKSRGELVKDLREQIETWRERHRALSRTNLFDLSNQEYDRMNYIDALIDYGTSVVEKHNREARTEADLKKQLERHRKLEELGI